MVNAIIMASGLGTRLRPLTEGTPKPLLAVKGTPMIETVIDALLQCGVTNIYIVVGYLGEQFNYLTKKYSAVKLIENKDYMHVNNISSIYYARHILNEGPCYICEADLYVKDFSFLNEDRPFSGYFGLYKEGNSEDWVFELASDGYIRRVGKSGNNCYNMVGFSYFTQEDASILRDVIETAYGCSGYEIKFWDDVVNENLDKLRLKIYPVQKGQIIEIDTVEEYKEVNTCVE